MQYIPIKEETENGEKIYIVNAISLKNKSKSIVQQIPHPQGTDILMYKTLQEAKEAIARAGFAYVLPDGKKEIMTKKTPLKKSDDYENIILNLIKDKINSTNSNVCQAAISVLGEFPSEETFSILFEKIGEENDLIRKNAISIICRYGKIVQNRIILALKADNWVTRNSALGCIKNLCEDDNIEIEKFITPLIEASNDANPIIQANALSTLAIVYQNYKKQK